MQHEGSRSTALAHHARRMEAAVRDCLLLYFGGTICWADKFLTGQVDDFRLEQEFKPVLFDANGQWHTQVAEAEISRAMSSLTSFLSGYTYGLKHAIIGCVSVAVERETEFRLLRVSLVPKK